MDWNLKRIIALILALLLSLTACAQTPVVQETQPTPDTQPSTEAPTVPVTEPVTEPAIDPFEVEDGIVDSTNDIVIDFYEFLEEREATHKAVLETTYSDEFIEKYTPDFHDTLDLVSKEEAEKLLHTPQGAMTDVTTKDAALKDVDLLFRIFKCFYGPYFYFGGDETFGSAENQIIQQIESGPATITLERLSGIISQNLDFVLDRHLMIGEQYICDYNNIAVYDFYVKGLYFYQDDVGYYTKINDRKWYLRQVGDDTNILDYLQITVDEKGQLCYCILLCESNTGLHLTVNEITLSRSERVTTMPIEWTMFQQRNNINIGISETITVKNNIPLLNVCFWSSGMEDASDKYDAQAERLRSMGRGFLSQDVFIYDFVSGSGCQSLFDFIDHYYVEIMLYRFSNLASDLGRWNMMWHLGEFGEYGVHFREGNWGKNDSLAFVVQDKANFSAAEGSIANIRAIDNILTIGGSTGGTAGPGGATCQGMNLYNTGLHIDFGATLQISAGYTEDGHCLEPDIWYEPAEAAEAAYRICQFYGIENTADTSKLAQYNYTEAFDTGTTIIHSDSNGSPYLKYTEFTYDLDQDGRAEPYIFGVSFMGASKVLPMDIDIAYATMDRGNFADRTVYPCVWQIQDDGSYTVVSEFAPLLTDVDLKISRVGKPDAKPIATEEMAYVWPGCTKVTLTATVVDDCIWQYAYTAKLGDLTLIATNATQFLPA